MLRPVRPQGRSPTAAGAGTHFLLPAVLVVHAAAGMRPSSYGGAFSTVHHVTEPVPVGQPLSAIVIDETVPDVGATEFAQCRSLRSLLRARRADSCAWNARLSAIWCFVALTSIPVIPPTTMPTIATVMTSSISTRPR